MRVIKKLGERGKVRSGQKIKKRPVIKAELWPHTIANEEEGEEVTSENIGLAKFISCFTDIMTDCGRAEASGRAELLHAVGMILECRPWAEARTFHNLIMVKLEQGRVDWSEDFSARAEQFMDKKVRQSVRSKGAVAGAAYSGRSNINRNFNRGSGARSGRAGSGNRNKPLYALICSQWNFGNCGYGDTCRKWHVCWSCAEAGKPGERHRASSHGNSGTGGEATKQQR